MNGWGSDYMSSVMIMLFFQQPVIDHPALSDDVFVFLRMSQVIFISSEWRILLFVLSVFWQSCPVTDTLVSLFVSAGTRVSTAVSRHKHESHQELSYFTEKSE